jgi:hypothetical protein
MSILCTGTLGGALVPISRASVQTSLFDRFWDKMDNFMRGALHLVGSFLPLRGLATIGKDLGFPYAEKVLAALTPTSFGAQFKSASVSQRRSDTSNPNTFDDLKYTSMRDEMSAAVGALLGNPECQKRLACLSGRHLSHVNGASSLALLASSATTYLPENLKEPLSIIKDSILYTDNCDQYLC